MTGFAERLTEGHILRHVPPGGNVDKSIALLDIAQDFLIARLASAGFFTMACFKGGTAVRKYFAGSKGRFSTDIDVAAVALDTDRVALSDILRDTAQNGDVGPFRFVGERRDDNDRWRLRVQTQFGSVPQSIKIDVGPPPWLTPSPATPIHAPIHDRYEFALPQIPVMRLEETLSEKIARLHRLSTARDAFDLVWCISTSPHSGFDRDLVRRLSVLKIWADVNGLAGVRSVAPRAGFDPEYWLRHRDDWDDESIGLLASPPPSLDELGTRLRQQYAWLQHLSPEESRWASCDPRDRASVVAAVAQLPNATLNEAAIWSHQSAT